VRFANDLNGIHQLIHQLMGLGLDHVFTEIQSTSTGIAGQYFASKQPSIELYRP
jgi:hypothetical protein